MKLFWIAALLLSVANSGHSSAGVIIQSTRKLRMSYTEPQPPKDFYVNMGSRDGVKVGDRLKVTRLLSLSDGFSDGAVLLVPVVLGTLQIVTVGETAAIGREDAPSPVNTLPGLQYTGFMVGDEVQVNYLPTPLPVP